MNRKQTGVALITVMLILSLATIMAVSMVSKQNIDIHRSANILNFDQAIEMTVYLENYAKRGLNIHFNDLRSSTTSQTDIFEWNKYVAVGISIDEISAAGRGRIEDVQARFNLNSLVDGGGNRVPLQQTRLVTLINNLNADLNLGLNIDYVDALIDWIDPNQNVYRNGAEDAVYTSLELPYTTANQHMNDISELLLVKGINYKQYKILREYVCVLDSAAAMNINTASEQVLRSLNPAISKIDAAALNNTAQAKNDNKGYGFDTPTAFVRDSSIASLRISEVGLDVSSNNFDVISEVRRNDAIIVYTSRLFRGSTGTIDVVKRRRNFFL